MLTTDQKEVILRRAGVVIPNFPIPRLSDRQPQGDAMPKTQTLPHTGAKRGTAAEQWAHAINVLFVEYSAARAAKSLRDAEEARLLDALRQAPRNPERIS
jgi:hypothetical protein